MAPRLRVLGDRENGNFIEFGQALRDVKQSRQQQRQQPILSSYLEYQIVDNCESAMAVHWKNNIGIITRLKV
jgi:hypothetical protein